MASRRIERGRFGRAVHWVVALGLLSGILANLAIDSSSRPAASKAAVPLSQWESIRDHVRKGVGSVRGPSLEVTIPDAGEGLKVFEARPMWEVLEQPGQTRLTLRQDLQSGIRRYLERLDVPELTLVAIDVRTGAILAVAGYLDGQWEPELALQARGPAASLYKLVSTAALLEGKGESPKSTVCYSGRGDRRVTQRLLDSSTRSAPGRTCRTLEQGVATSDNAVIGVKTASSLNRRLLMAYSDAFGFNRAIPFDWPVQVSSAKLPRAALDLANAGAGFGDVQISALHAAMVAAAIANDGVMMVPGLVEAIVDGHGREAYHRDAEPLRRLVSSKTAHRLGRMMLLGTSEGSSRKTFGRRHKVLAGMEIASKTGSLNGVVDGRTYHFTWYIGYAPVSQPEIAVAVMVRNPMSWVVKAGEVALETFTLYFMGNNEKRDP